jgi:hypothetical protein
VILPGPESGRLIHPALSEKAYRIEVQRRGQAMLKPLGLLILALPAATAAYAEEVPRFDIKAICGAAPSIGQSAQATDRGCIHDETQARTQLEQQWPGFKTNRRNACVQEVSIGGPPSYVALLTCLQM